jgi:hypothetical protein
VEVRSVMIRYKVGPFRVNRRLFWWWQRKRYGWRP